VGPELEKKNMDSFVEISMGGIIALLVLKEAFSFVKNRNNNHLEKSMEKLADTMELQTKILYRISYVVEDNKKLLVSLAK